jgi:hypothetical protein
MFRPRRVTGKSQESTMQTIQTLNATSGQTGIQHTDVGARAVDLGRGTQKTSLSSQWWSRPADQRFTSLTELRDFALREWKGSRAQTYDAKDLELWAPENPASLDDTKDLRILLPDGQGSFAKPTHWSFGQACSLLEAPASFLRELPSQIVADVLGYRLAKHRSEMVKVYHRTDGTAELRAITGPDYGRVPDFEVVEAIMRVAGNGTGDTHWKVPGTMQIGSGWYDPNTPITKENTTLYASDRDLFTFLVDDKNPIEVGKLKNGDPDLMFRGFMVWNSEVGAKSIGVATMYLRAVCCNRILWGVEGYEEIVMRHSKRAPDRFINEAAPALEQFAMGNSMKLVEGVKAAKEAIVAKTEDEGLAFLQARKFSKARAKAILAAVEQEEGAPASSVWDMAQGITAVARTIEHQDIRVDMEKTAKALLDKVA